jgi:hypothetical protein
VASVVSILEREAPSFLTLNKHAASNDLEPGDLRRAEQRAGQALRHLHRPLQRVRDQSARLHQRPDRKTPKRLGLSTPSPTSARTRAIPTWWPSWKSTPTLRPTTARPTIWCTGSRTRQTIDYNAGNFFDYASNFPRLLIEIAAKVGAPADLFERTSGHRRIDSYDPPEVTLVDTVFENMLRAMSAGYHLTLGHRRALESTLAHCRPDRMAQFAELWTYSNTVQLLAKKEAEAKHFLGQARENALATSRVFIQSTAP